MKSFGGMTDYPTFVLFNPSRLLTWLSQKIGRFLFSGLGVIAIVAYLIVGLYAFSLITFDNITFSAFDIFFIYLFLTTGSLFHELGHGFACQHYGGNVTEIGYTLFFYFRLIPYCDTSSSYLIQSRRHKMIVQLAGSVATLIYSATMAIILAVLAPTVPIYSALAVALVLDSAFVFVGLIPLLKNDGYYAVADYLNFPNLRERSMKLARAWLAKKLFGIEIETEDLPARTRRRMIAFGIAARLGTMSFVLFMYLRFIITPLVVHFRGAGLAFALLLTAYLFRNLAIKPVFRSIATLVRERRKIFTLRRTAVLAVLLGLVVGPWFLVKWPVLVDSEFVIVPANRADVRARIAGRVDQILVGEGQPVRKGQPIAILRNPELRTQITVLEAEREIAALDVQRLENGARPEELALAKKRVETERAETRMHANAAARARVLASAALGTQSSADLAAGRVAAEVGETGAAKAELSLLEAGARPEAIKMAQAELARIDSELAHLRSEAQLLTLTSPIDGVVVSRHLEERLDENLAVGDLFAEVHDPDTLVAEIQLKEHDPLDQIAVGDEVALKPYGVPDADVRVRITKFREAVEKKGEDRQIVAVTSPFSVPHGIAGLTGHARVYGNEHSLAYANFYMPFQRIVRVRLWSLW
jgi:putative peptide zinc metalloprotease protein